MPTNDGRIYRTRVRPAEAGQEVLDFHAARFRHSTRADWQARLAAGLIRRNGHVARAGESLAVGDELEFHRPPWDEPAAPRAFTVVYEDEHVLALDKPAGLQVLPGGPFDRTTLLHLVRASAPERADAAPVHRLGRGTSGLVLCARSALARTALAAEFRACRPTKTYLALVQGERLPTSFVARTPIGRRAHGPMMLCTADPAGRPAATRVRVLRRASGSRALVAAQPITGRPDQIRIHLAAAGAPLVGDPLFGPGGVPISDAQPGHGGYFLHAASLRVRHPASGAWLTLRCRAPWEAELAVLLSPPDSACASNAPAQLP